MPAYVHHNGTLVASIATDAPKALQNAFKDGIAKIQSEAWLAATEVLPTAGSTVALLSWLHRCAPDAWSAATHFTLPAGFVLELLGGDAAVSSADAVGTAVLDLHTGERWRTDLLAVVDAAYTAPIIMMSQNRQADVDRDRAVADYQVNLRAEADIALLHEKLDLLRERQLMEMTQLLKHAIERIEQLETRRA